MTDKIQHEDHYKVEVGVTRMLPQGGREHTSTELARTVECYDAAGKYIPDPLVDVIRRGADALEEKLANGEFADADFLLFNAFMYKSRTLTLTQKQIGDAEESAGIPRSC